MDIEVRIERKPTGIGGALWQARDCLDDEFFLLDGDSWFDHDGVLNQGYVGSVARFRWMEGARDAVKELNEAGFCVFTGSEEAHGVGYQHRSNQSCPASL